MVILIVKTILLWLIVGVPWSSSAAVGQQVEERNSDRSWRPQIELPRSGIEPRELGLVVNSLDPLSVKIAAYYQRKRGLPEENILRIEVSPGRRTISRAEFDRIKRQVDAAAPNHIQAYLLAWQAPFRVECMSITSAFALGFDTSWCATGCNKTEPSPYYANESLAPFSELGIRPAMMLAASTFERARQLIDRGVRADGTLPRGRVYLLETSDSARSVRRARYPEVERRFGPVLPVHVVRSDAIRYKKQVLFYFTGLPQVEGIDTNHYLPGAIADHLTSTGGQLTGGSQMSAQRWLEAGATGSYGSVVEPCNFLEKFPDPVVLLHYYLQGNTLLEAYWKSVAMPGQGVFIGEPLARPYRGMQLRRINGQWLVTSPLLGRGSYRVLAAENGQGPYSEIVSRVSVLPMQPGILLPAETYEAYRIERIAQ